MSQPVQRPRIVIVGGGAGGIQLAIRLARKRGRPFAITLIDVSETHVWKPLLHEIGSGSTIPASHEVSFRALARWHGFTFCHGRFEGLDRDRRIVSIAAVEDEEGIVIPPREIAYDRAVMAVGSVSNDFGVPGVPQLAFNFDDAAEAADFQKSLLRACLRANYADPHARPEGLKLVIVGGGATGVELAAELRAATRDLIDYGLDNLDPERFVRITLLNADPRLLLQLPEHISEAISDVLASLNIGIHNNEAVTAVDKGAVTTKSGSCYAADLVLWAAGIKGRSELRDLAGLETNKLDQLVVTGTLQSTRDPNVLAIGDCAAAPWVGRKGTVPPRAQAAEQEARYLANALPKMIAGGHPAPFRYNDLGSLVSLGDANTIGTLMGFARGRRVRIEGLIARLIYRGLYKRHQAVMFGRWAVFLDTIGGWLRGATRPRVKLH